MNLLIIGTDSKSKAHAKLKFSIEHRSTGGSVVEFSPATREARVRFPASAKFCSQLEGIIAVEF